MKHSVFREGDLRFEFATESEKFDVRSSSPHGMKFVDFVISGDKENYLLEVKNPSDSQIPSEYQHSTREEFAKKMLDGELINHELVPKARDSYCFLHLMKRDDKPFVFVVLLGLSEFTNEEALLMGFKDGLNSRLNNECDTPWKRKYVKDCIVVTEAKWKNVFPEHKLHRINDETTSTD
ncbi:MAG: hypothetical protein KAR11_07925 [Phycisphaerae bacterium]|nr:hypothetical protein [Phycisphaerae bacterium]